MGVAVVYLALESHVYGKLLELGHCSSICRHRQFVSSHEGSSVFQLWVCPFSPFYGDTCTADANMRCKDWKAILPPILTLTRVGPMSGIEPEGADGLWSSGHGMYLYKSATAGRNSRLCSLDLYG